VIGIIAAPLVIESCFFFERRGVDDPVGAISVHGVGGIFGVLCVGIFSSGDYGAGWNLTTKGAAATASGVTGILYDFDLGIRQLGSQAIGALTIMTVIFGVAFAFFKIQNAIMKGGIRPTAEVEEQGMDIPEMGVLAYDNMVVNELDIVSGEGVEEVMSGGPSPDPTIGR
jgi:Amt family ammonium transporter